MDIEKIYREHGGAIRHVATKYAYLFHGDISEAISYATIPFVQACKRYDASKGMSLKNYLFLCLDTCFKNYYRRTSRKDALNTLSLDHEYEYFSDGNTTSLEDMVEDTTSRIEDKVVNESFVEEIKQFMIWKYGQVKTEVFFKVCLNVINQEQAAQEIGVTQSYYSRLHRKMLKFVQERFKFMKNFI